MKIHIDRFPPITTVAHLTATAVGGLLALPLMCLDKQLDDGSGCGHTD